MLVVVENHVGNICVVHLVLQRAHIHQQLAQTHSSEIMHLGDDCFPRSAHHLLHISPGSSEVHPCLISRE